jgi:protocatechuate 3,4-dioxygenase beta subunit
MKTRDKCTHYVNAAETRLKDDGTFEFSDLSSGKYTFQILPAESAFEEVETEVNDDFNYLEIVLKGGAKISGKILDENGKPLKAAKITTDKKQLSAVSDSEGNYSLNGIKLGDCMLKVTAKGYAMPGYVSVKVDCREAKSYRKDISLARTGAMLVEIEPQEKGVKIPDKISLNLNFSTEDFRGWGYSDLHGDVKDGKALFGEVAPGKYTVNFRSEDTAQLQGEVVIESGKESTLKFILPRTVDLSGKVLDEGGTPVKDVNLNLEFIEDKTAFTRRTYSPGHAQTQADGSFVIKKLKAGKYRVCADKEGFARSAQIVNVESESRELPTITLKKGLSLSGVILETGGGAAGNVDLNLNSDYESRKESELNDYTSKQLKISADGKFKAEGLNPGKYNISVRDANHNYEIASVLKIDAGSEDTVITLGKKHPVSGKVLDVSGNPVSDTEISVSGSSAGRSISYGGSGKNKTGINGDFTLNLREGLKYTLRFSHPTYLEKIVDFDPASGTDNLKVVLEKGCSVVGKVVKGKDNSPVEGVIVRAGVGYYHPVEREDEETAARRKTDREGRFSLETVPAGSVSFSVYALTGNRPLFSKNIPVKKDQINDIVIAMPEMVLVKGKVLDSEGKPLSLTRLFLTSQENYQINHNVQSDGNGDFEIKDLIPGKYNVRAEKEGFAIFAKNLNIGAESKEPLAITLNKGLGISGTILEADGKPAGNVGLTLTVDSTSRTGGDPTPYISKQLKISADGKFKVEGLNPGKYNLSVRDANLFYEITSVLKIDAGSDGTIVALGKIHPVSGTVLDPSGNPVSGVEISVGAKNPVSPSYISNSPNNSVKSKTGVKGDFALNLREGLKYSLRFSHPGYLDKLADFDPASGNDKLTIVLGKGCSVSGKVVRVKDNSPVEGVIVKVGSNTDFGYTGRTGKTPESSGKTGSDGRFSLETVPSGVVSFSVYLDKQPKPLFSKSMMVKKDQKEDIVLVMPEMVSVSVKVLDSEGNPIPSANVSLNSENLETYYSANADGNGIFEIKDVIPGKYSAYFNRPNAPGAIIEYNVPEIIEISSGGAKEIVLRRKDKSGTGEKMSGALKINGKTRSGGKIQFTPMIVGRQPDAYEMARIYSGQGKSDISADGKFSVEKMKPGKYLFLVRGDTVGQVFEPLVCSGIVEIKDGMSMIELDVKAFSVSGAVVDSDGKSATGLVQVKPEFDGVIKTQKEMLTLSAQVKDGRYKFDYVPAGSYRLSASNDDSGTFIRNFEVKNEDQTIDARLPKGFRLSGRITAQDAEEQNSNPLSFTFVFAYSKGQDKIYSGMTNEDGSYVIRSLNQGEYELFAVKKDYALEGVPVKIDKDAELNMAFVPGGELDLTLKSDKLPVKDRLVILKDENGREVRRLSDGPQLYPGRFFKACANVPTNDSGKTSFSGLKPGTYRLSVKDCRISPETVKIKPLEKTVMEFELQ